jgi:hypothetical protein
MEQTKYTVFYQGGFLTDGNCGCHALEDFLTETVVRGMPPIAWAPVCYWDWARENPGRDCDELRAESIAAGRTIEMIDNQWVPRGVPVEDKPAKSIGAILREKLYDDGRKLASDPSAIRDRDHIHVAAKAPDFDPWKGFFTEPADMADWQDTYYPR